VYHYDLFGNLIGESRPDGTILREWVYVNGQKLAMILPAEGGGGGGCEAPSGPSFPSCSSLAARPGAEAGAGAVLLLLGPAFIVIGLKYHRRKYTILGLTFIGGLLFLVLMPQAQSQTPAETIYYYHNDHLGTPKVLTDQTGAVVWDVDYTPFGEISAYVTNTLPTDQPFRFPGQYADSLTGMYYNWNRYYMPKVGRYGSFDKFQDFQPPYSYAFNNPVNYFDTQGCSGCKEDDHACWKKKCMKEGYWGVTEGMEKECDKFGDCCQEIIANCKIIGDKICEEWAKPNNIRKINTKDLRKWGQKLKDPPKECEKRHNILDEVENERKNKMGEK